jgi:hypothetical protein
MKEENIRRRLDAMLGAGGRRVRDRLVLDLHLPVPRMDALPPRPGDLRGRRGAPGLALRRARREFRACRTSTTSAGSWACDRGPGAREPARQLRRRARPRRRREHPELHPRSTDFITPKTEMSRIFRDAVLDLAEHHEFARPLVNSGRLSVPCVYDGSPLNVALHAARDQRGHPGARRGGRGHGDRDRAPVRVRPDRRAARPLSRRGARGGLPGPPRSARRGALARL